MFIPWWGIVLIVLAFAALAGAIEENTEAIRESHSRDSDDSGDHIYDGNASAMAADQRAIDAVEAPLLKMGEWVFHGWKLKWRAYTREECVAHNEWQIWLFRCQDCRDPFPIRSQLFNRRLCGQCWQQRVDATRAKPFPSMTNG